MQKLSILTAVLLVVTLGTIACGGGGKPDLQALATSAADATPSPTLEIRARGVKFDKDTLVVPAGREVVLTFDNQDGGTTHNLAVYTSQDAKENLFRGDLFPGKEKREYRFQAPAAGVYYFRCDAHPEMQGVFVAK